jgi:TRAP-type C4-dicarboxylate transport system permease small subunit
MEEMLMGNCFDDNRKWNHIEEVCCAILMAVMLALLFAQVVLRFVFSKSSPVIEEYSLYMFLYFVYLEYSNAILRDEHIKIEALLAKFPVILKVIVLLLTYVANIVFSVIMVKYGMMRAMDQLQLGTKSATLFPLWIMTFSLPLGLGFGVIRSIQRIYYLIKFEVLKKGGGN